MRATKYGLTERTRSGVCVCVGFFLVVCFCPSRFS